ncbi:SHOCT domain-containing protein [Candidatus Woesebacteria bacterium]|nr:MAG: SHOCT domain-containing protein [Candidatus Woesebacteria bacterium]
MTDTEEIKSLIASLPAYFNASVDIDADGLLKVLATEGVKFADVLAASWCTYNKWNIESSADAPTLVFIHTKGFIVSVGKNKFMSKAIKYESIPFTAFRNYAPIDYNDQGKDGKFCIEFMGSGGVLIGRLQWRWWSKRFHNASKEIMAVCDERDRILAIISKAIGGQNDDVDANNSTHNNKPETPPSSSIAEEIKKLADMRKQNIITNEEFKLAKKQLLENN